MNALMKNNQLKSILLFVCLSYFISWMIWWIGMSRIPELINISDERFYWYLIAGSFAPTISALIITAISNGWPGVKSLVGGLIRVKVNWKIYLITFFLLPIIGITTYMVFGISNKVDFLAIVTTAILLMPLNALLGGVIFGIGPLGEEMGWRGFLQDRLQGQSNTVVIAIIIGFIWAAWHLPLVIRFDDFRGGLNLTEFCVYYVVFTMLLAFIMTHLWRLSRGSLLIAILFHGVSNMTVDIYLLNKNWWDFGDMTQLQIYLFILLIYALMAIVVELLSRSLLLNRSISRNSNNE